MTYEEAMNQVAAGAAVIRGGLIVYMSVDFSSGLAGKIVTSVGLGGDTIFEPSPDDTAATDWELFTVAQD
ncbi:TPA: hypothetical protein MYU74_000768 [Klebsiella pneumoniae]|uniref:hypothetical protein n=1 Tax=Klebsiella pneumoniae TaxID=573 RepID=UPI00388FD94C|nr:hypothetical protein [Klebsiella pneumoniae]HCB3510233.1 hypothetical protein [Klebsiella pneumoniae]